MLLTDKKLINNSRLPGFSGGVDLSILPKPGSADFYGHKNKFNALLKATPKNIPVLNNVIPKEKSSISGELWASGAVSALGTILEGISAANDYIDSAEALASRKTGTGYVGGIPYNRYSLNDSIRHYNSGKLPEYGNGTALLHTLGGAASGAAAGTAILPGWGTAIGAVGGALIGGIGSIIGSDAEDRAWARAAELNTWDNMNSFNGAYNTLLRKNSAKKYGNQQSLLLSYSAGKTDKIDPITGYTTDMHILHTPDGIKIGPANSKVEPGEVGWNASTGALEEFALGKTKKRKGDILYSDLGPNDVVFSDRLKVPGTNMTFAEAAKNAKTYDELLMYADMMGSVLKKKNIKPGITKAKEGWLGTAVPYGLGALASIGQTLAAYRNRPYRPSTYRVNPYENEGLSTLAQLSVNPYPIMRQLRNAEARTNRAIDMSGLAGGQRLASRLSALNTTQRSIADALSNIQAQNNQYKANYAQAAINAGNATRTARMQADQWDLDTYAKAHAARQKGIQTGIYNILNNVQQYMASDFKRRQFNDMMDLYKADLKELKKYNQYLSKLINTDFRNQYPFYSISKSPNQSTSSGSYKPYWYNDITKLHNPLTDYFKKPPYML